MKWLNLKTHFNFLKGIIIQEGSSGAHFDHGQFEINTFPIYTTPCWWDRLEIAVDVTGLQQIFLLRDMLIKYLNFLGYM